MHHKQVTRHKSRLKYLDSKSLLLLIVHKAHLNHIPVDNKILSISGQL